MYLHEHATRPLPPDTAGALLLSTSLAPDRPLPISWQPLGSVLAPGRIRLHWQAAPTAGWDVKARLGLHTGDVLLATWPSAPDHWPDIARPTLYEVRGLYAALRLATKALTLAI